MQWYLTVVFEHQGCILRFTHIRRAVWHVPQITTRSNPDMARIPRSEHGAEMFRDTRQIKNIQRVKLCSDLDSCK